MGDLCCCFYEESISRNEIQEVNQKEKGKSLFKYPKFKNSTTGRQTSRTRGKNIYFWKQSMVDR